MSASNRPYFSGSASAASTMASAFSSVRRAMPVAFAAFLSARPALRASGNLPDPFPPTRPPSRCLSFPAASRSIGFSARLMATASDSVKSLRTAFSANSPSAICGEVDNGDGDVGPSELLSGAQPALAGNQGAVGADDDGMQQPQLSDAARESVDVTELTAVAGADADPVNGENASHGSGLRPGTLALARAAPALSGRYRRDWFRCGGAAGQPGLDFALVPGPRIGAGQLAARKTAVADPILKGGPVIDDAGREKIAITQAFLHGTLPVCDRGGGESDKRPRVLLPGS